MQLMAPRKHSAIRRIAASRKGVAALEFALLTPIMATMVIGVFDLSKAVILWEQTWDAARSINESASTLALQPDGSTSLTQAQAQQALSTIFAAMPWLRAGIATGNPGAGLVPPNTVSAVLSSVSYQPTVSGCTSSCTYAAVVEWSKAYSGYNFMTQSSVLRPCVTLTQTSASAAQSSSTVPVQAITSTYQSQNTTVPDAFTMVDVTFKYTPYFFKFITGPVTFSATSFLPVRSTAANSTTPWTTYSATSTADPASAQCTTSSTS